VTTRRLQDFDASGQDKGRGIGWQVAWWIVSNLVFQAWWCPARLRPRILRAFGARVGRGGNIRNGVRVHWPWKLEMGDHCWIGEGAWLLCLDTIRLGDQVCISQEAVLCTGSHHIADPNFAYDNGPITVGDGAWVALRAIVLRGAVIPADGFVPAGAVVGRPRVADGAVPEARRSAVAGG
jgi:putative colanic acid biosynthesis acetyltransferase WcaF